MSHISSSRFENGMSLSFISDRKNHSVTFFLGATQHGAPAETSDLTTQNIFHKETFRRESTRLLL